MSCGHDRDIIRRDYPVRSSNKLLKTYTQVHSVLFSMINRSIFIYTKPIVSNLYAAMQCIFDFRWWESVPKLGYLNTTITIMGPRSCKVLCCQLGQIWLQGMYVICNLYYYPQITGGLRQHVETDVLSIS